jgi:hypothetical protein
MHRERSGENYCKVGKPYLPAQGEEVIAGFVGTSEIPQFPNLELVAERNLMHGPICARAPGEKKVYHQWVGQETGPTVGKLIIRYRCGAGEVSDIRAVAEPLLTNTV